MLTYESEVCSYRSEKNISKTLFDHNLFRLLISYIKRKYIVHFKIIWLNPFEPFIELVSVS